jgi:hypothetical protein
MFFIINKKNTIESIVGKLPIIIVKLKKNLIIVHTFICDWDPWRVL